MTTSIDILPDDLLLDIFLVAKDYHAREHPQIAISQVCKRWRSLALTNPLIWNKLHLDCNAPLAAGLSRNGHNKSISQIFLERSSPLLLDVVVVDEWDTLNHEAHADLLEPCASRASSLDMTCIRIYFPGLKDLFARIGPIACNIRSMKLSKYEVWYGAEELPSEAPAPFTMQLEMLTLAPSMCIACLPFPLGSITHLELREFLPTRSHLSFLFRNMPMLSTLAIEVDHLGLLAQHHFHSHESTIDFELEASPLIASSSLQKLALVFAQAQSKMECSCGLDFLDVQNLKYLELRLNGTSAPSKENSHQSTFRALNDRLLSLETLVLTSAELLAPGDNQKFICSSHAGGINLVIQTTPTFETHQKIMSSFAAIASLTYYLPSVTLPSHYDGAPVDVKERLRDISFPITFIPTPRWQTSFIDKPFHSHPLLMVSPTDELPSCEAVEFIRHTVKMAKGGQIPVRYVDSPSCLPGVISSESQDHSSSAIRNEWDDEEIDDGDGTEWLEPPDFEEFGWGEVDHDDYMDDVYGAGYGSDYEPDFYGGEELEDDGESDGGYEAYW